MADRTGSQTKLYARRILPHPVRLILLTLAFLALLAGTHYGLSSRYGRGDDGAVLGKVDIDIGTKGSPMRSTASKLITFDPGDKQLLTEKLERYPVVIADHSGLTNFYINRAEGGCSSLNRRNEEYNTTLQDAGMWNRCKVSRQDWLKSRLPLCMHSPLVKARVRAMLLSRFLKERRIRHVGILKIDAQGSDFSILKDILEHTTDHEVKFDTIVVECQTFNQTVPLYFASNSCEDIETYVKEKMPDVKFNRNVNNCMVNEWNLIMTDLKRMSDPERETTSIWQRLWARDE